MSAGPFRFIARFVASSVTCMLVALLLPLPAFATTDAFVNGSPVSQVEMSDSPQPHEETETPAKASTESSENGGDGSMDSTRSVIEPVPIPVDEQIEESGLYDLQFLDTLQTGLDQALLATTSHASGPIPGWVAFVIGAVGLACGVTGIVFLVRGRRLQRH